MRLDELYLWYLGDPVPRYVGALKLVGAGKGVSLHYGADWLAHGFALSEGKTPRWPTQCPNATPLGLRPRRQQRKCCKSLPWSTPGVRALRRWEYRPAI